MSDNTYKDMLARSYANDLFNAMGNWDRFDIALHDVDRILSMIDRELALYVKHYYDLSELLSSAKHYRTILNRIIKKLEEVLSE